MLTTPLSSQDLPELSADSRLQRLKIISAPNSDCSACDWVPVCP